MFVKISKSDRQSNVSPMHSKRISHPTQSLSTSISVVWPRSQDQNLCGSAKFKVVLGAVDSGFEHQAEDVECAIWFFGTNGKWGGVSVNSEKCCIVLIVLFLSVEIPKWVIKTWNLTGREDIRQHRTDSRVPLRLRCLRAWSESLVRLAQGWHPRSWTMGLGCRFSIQMMFEKER